MQIGFLLNKKSPHGQGTKTMRNGDIYDGNFVDGLLQGEGNRFIFFGQNQEDLKTSRMLFIKEILKIKSLKEMEYLKPNQQVSNTNIEVCGKII